MTSRYSLAALQMLTLFAIGVGPARAQIDIESQFASWAADSHHEITTLDMDASAADLAVIGAAIGDDRIVFLGEAMHGAAEPLQFRNRLFRYLVEEHGFSALAIETGVTESRVIHDYVRTGNGDLSTVVREGLGWTFDQLPQNETLIRWMRQYNADRPESARLSFFGYDVPGSPGNSDASNGPEIALIEAIRYLAVVDPDAAQHFSNRFSRFLVRLDEYPDLSDADKDALATTVADLVSLIERRRFEYTAISGRTEYEWARRAALGVHQVNSMFRTQGWLDTDQSRTRAMADNFAWILNQLEPNARLLVFGANGHIAAAPQRVAIDPGVDDVTLGMYVKQEFQDEVLTIGHSAANGMSGNCGRVPGLRLSSPPPASLDAQLASIGTPLFVLDLRESPDGVSQWLDEFQEHNNGFGTVWYQYSRAMDLIFFSGPVSPACPL